MLNPASRIVAALTTAGALLASLLVGCSSNSSAPGGADPGGSQAGSGGAGAGGGGPGPATQVGVVTLRRLNRTQYGNTLRSLTGSAVDVASKIPADNLSFGFDNIGEALTVQPLHIELFEQGADSVLSELFARPAADPMRAKVLSCDPQAAGTGCVTNIVTQFAERAFRRPVTPADVAPFLAVADKVSASGGTVTDGLKWALRGVLLSPHFLFRVELDPSPTSKDVHRLGAYELAARLSYYLWSDMPDDALLASARSDALRSDAGLIAEISRMLADAKARALVSDFAGQWLNIRRVATVAPDETTFPAYTVALGHAMQTETSLLFGELLGQGRPIAELLTSDFTFVDRQLAAFYGLPAPSDDGFVKTSLSGSHRKGFLMHGSFLALTSNPTRTSPVKRGKWVLEQLLCAPPPPPPMGVDISGVDGAGQSVRARLEQHRAKEPCRSCHAVMDPIGLSFEHFDAIGAYRAADEYGPIDATGSLPTRTGVIDFDGAEELVPILAQDPRLAPCVAEKILTYAVGRGFTAQDADAIAGVLAGMEASGQGLRGLVGSVALSEAFRSRRAVGE